MGEIGLEGVEVIRYPADGVTAYGGWVMPQAWDVEEATLEIADFGLPISDCQSEIGNRKSKIWPASPALASYRDCPQALMMYSAPTPPEGVVAEVVALDKAGVASSYEGIDVRGKIVLVDSPWIDTALLAFGRGAVGLVCDAMKLAGTPQDKGGGTWTMRSNGTTTRSRPGAPRRRASGSPSHRPTGAGCGRCSAPGNR